MGPLSVGAFSFLYQVLPIKKLQVYICSLIFLKHTCQMIAQVGFERSCRYVEWAWRLLLDVSRIILCYVNAGKFGVWSCTCAFGLIVCNFCLLFNMVRVASWNSGWGCGWVQAHCYCKWARSFETGIQPTCMEL